MARTRRKGGGFGNRFSRFLGRPQRKSPEFDVKGKLQQVISDVKVLEGLNNNDIIPSIQRLNTRVALILQILHKSQQLKETPNVSKIFMPSPYKSSS